MPSPVEGHQRRRWRTLGSGSHRTGRTIFPRIDPGR